MKKKLQDELRQVMGQLKNLRAVADPTEEQLREIDEALARAESLETQIQEATQREERAAALEARNRASANPLPTGDQLPSGIPQQRQIVIPATARRATRVFKTPEQAFAAGQFFRASVGQNINARRWCEDHGIALRAQTEGDNTKGGYLVPIEIGEIIDALQAQYGIMRQYAQVVPMGSDTKLHPKRPLSSMMNPTGELGTGGSKTATFGNIELVARKFMDFYDVSSELDEDSAISLAEELAMVIASAAAYTEDKCGWMGDGTDDYNRMVGVFARLNAISSNVGVKTATGADTYLEITEDHLRSVKGCLPSAAEANGDTAWYCTNKALTETFERLALAKGGVTAAEVIAGATPRFLGKPIRVVEAITENETSGGFALAYGSLRKGVILGDRRQLTVVSSAEAGFLTDSTKVRASIRFDVNVHEPGSSSAAGALAILKFA